MVKQAIACGPPSSNNNFVRNPLKFYDRPMPSPIPRASAKSFVILEVWLKTKSEHVHCKHFVYDFVVLVWCHVLRGLVRYEFIPNELCDALNLYSRMDVGSEKTYHIRNYVIKR